MKYKISNKELEISIDSLGAQLCSLKTISDKHEYLWQANEKYWAKHSPILFPIVGKLLDDEYFYKNKKYSMTQHGFARDMEFSFFKSEDNYLCFKLESTSETLAKYPFEFELYLGYKIENRKLICSYKVVNKNDFEMPFSIGAHPAFNWSLKKEDKEFCFFEFSDTKELERLPLTPNGISSKKELIKLENSRLDLNEELFKDDALVIENLKNKTIVFKNEKDSRFVKVNFEGFEYLGLWSKPNGAPFVCIEPWYGVADFIEHNKNFEEKKGLIKLQKAEEFESFYSIEI